MSDFYTDLAGYIREFVKCSPKGAEMPDELCESIIWNFLYESVKDRWFITDNFARWFAGEFDFSQDQVDEVISQVGRMATEVGFEVIFPGQPMPEELQAPQQDAPVATESYEDSTGTAATDDSPTTVAEETGEIPGGMMEIGQTPTMDDAAKILEAVANRTVGVDQTVSQALLEKVISTPYTISMFDATSPATGFETPVVRHALCLLALLEIDYLHYTGAKKVSGFSISAAVKNTQDLLNRTPEMKNNIEEIEPTLTEGGQLDTVGELQALIRRVDEIGAELNNLVTAFSEMPDEDVTPPPVEAPPPKVTPKEARVKREKESKIKPADIAKITGAVIIMLAIVISVSLYLRSILVAPPLRVFDVSNYTHILPLKEARQSGKSFYGIVPSSEWNKLTKDEKNDRAQRLLIAAKDKQIESIVLADETGKLLVQTYGGTARVIR